jgi:hypothetical protein
MFFERAVFSSPVAMGAGRGFIRNLSTVSTCGYAGMARWEP